MGMQRLFLAMALVAVVALSVFAGAAVAQEPAPVKVLLVGGDDVAPYHDHHEITEKTREALMTSKRFDVKVCEDPLILESSAALKGYDVIVLTRFDRGTPAMTDQAKANLLSFVKGGKGFYVQHLGSASFPKWDEFVKLCGRKWVMGTSGHGPRGVFDVKIVKKDHPITQGMGDFKIFDELYSKLQGDGDIEVLVSAYSDWSEKEEPLVFTTPYGKGRCVHNALGHDFKAILNPSMVQLLCRSVEWAATGKVQ
jgi:type 1 glutamine amidotransferase